MGSYLAVIVDLSKRMGAARPFRRQVKITFAIQALEREILIAPIDSLV